MNEELTALVIGVGGNVSQGILKAIHASQIPVRVVGACISPYSMGLYTVDKAYVSPNACSETFIPWLLETCLLERVNVILSGVEEVLEVLSRNRQKIESLTGAVCIVSGPEAIEISRSKLRTCEWLRNNGFNYPLFAKSDDSDALRELIDSRGFPLIAKPIVGKSAVGVRVVKHIEELREFLGREDYIIQEYLGNENTEFTSSCYVGSDGAVKGSIILKRDLLCGTTYRAEAVENEEMRKEVEGISAALKPLGPCNIQLRLHHGLPICFEINLRFSGTAPIRARMGFNDVEAAIRDFVLKENIAPLASCSDLIALRYWNEIYVKRESFERLKKERQMDNSLAGGNYVEDYRGRL